MSEKSFFVGVCVDFVSINLNLKTLGSTATNGILIMLKPGELSTQGDAVSSLNDSF